MTGTYWKIPYVWTDGTRSAPPSLPAGARWAPATDVPGFLALVADCVAASVDEWDRSAVAHVGALRAAEIVTRELSGYSHSPDWWQVILVDGQPAGFVLPATFDGCRRDGLDEGTILHVGVRPSLRGRGLGRALLRKATAVLTGHGVWRIYCDTAAGNAAMTRLFESEGWQRLEPHERPTFQSG